MALNAPKSTVQGLKDTAKFAWENVTGVLEDGVLVPQRLLTGETAGKPLWKSLVKFGLSPVSIPLVAIKNIAIGAVRDGLRGLGKLALNLPVLPVAIREKIEKKWRSDKDKLAINPEGVKPKVGEGRFDNVKT